MPPILPNINIKEKFKSDIANDKSLLTPAFAKKYTVEASRSPKPPIEIGNRVIALIIGKNTRKYPIFILNPNDNPRK